MTIHHHPSDDTLLRHAAGSVPAATRRIVAAHVEGCRCCAETIGRFEAIGGVLLDEMAATPLSSDCLARTWALIEADERMVAARQTAILRSPRRPDGIVLPRALDDCDVGPWRWLGPGIHLSRIRVPGAPEANLVLLKVAPNRPLPEHGHTGTEFTQVLSGSLIDGALRLLPGDLMEADQDLQHQPVAGPEGECISLAAIEGKLRIGGIIGRTVLSLVGL